MRKISARFGAFAALAIAVVGFAQSTPGPAPVQFTVVFNSSTLPANAATIISNAGGTITGTIPQIGVATVSGPANVLAGLNANPQILTATPEVWLDPPKVRAFQATTSFPTTGADLYNVYQWDIKQVTNTGASYDLSTGSHNTVIGIVDSGVSTNHPALKANLLGGRNFTPDGPGGTLNPSDIEDRNGHGSHVAGTIAGNGRILGVGPHLGFKSYRVFGATGGSPFSRILTGMIAAVDDGVDVISMSIGGYYSISGATWTDPATGIVYRYKDVADFVAQRRAAQYAANHGVLVVVAAGNEATDIGNPSSVTPMLNAMFGPQGYVFYGASREVPGTIAGVLTVSATGPTKALASYSNYGFGAIDITAPGGDFLRYPIGDWYTDMCLSADKGSGYTWMAGTSMATPKVSAVAALIIDQAKAQGRHLLPQQVTTILEQSAVRLGSGNTVQFFGSGMVNAYMALLSR